MPFNMDNVDFVNLPVMALRGIVIFPKTVIHFDVGRKKSIAAVKSAMDEGRHIFLIAQQQFSDEEPTVKSLYSIGCVAKIKQVLKLPNDGIRVLVEGVCRAKAYNVTDNSKMLRADAVELFDSTVRINANTKEALLRRTRDLFEAYADLMPKVSPDVVMTVYGEDNIAYISDYIIDNISVSYDDKQFVLEQTNPVKRIKSVISLLGKEIEILKIDAKINETVKDSIDKNQRDYYLREQVKAINDELYGAEDPMQEADEYKQKIAALKTNDDVKNKLITEVNRLSKMPYGSQEGTVLRTYIDICLELPWGVYTDSKISLTKSREILERDHFGLEKVKERVIELMAVYSRVPDIKGQIICLVGPPGVGKTSIAKSIAECMDRKFQRISLGGVSDESEIRGHRRTYIGSMPGRVINAIKNAGSSNPVILLDEIDKLGSSYKGDPYAALLETLDSEQNLTFNDHYIGLPFDLSRVLFITTANSLDTIPAPLLDRMEVIELNSYTREEKFNIAKLHLVKKEMKYYGLNGKNIKFTDEAIYKMIDSYTREAGVRKLDRMIASVCRKATAEIVEKDVKVTVNSKKLKEYFGKEKYKDSNIAKKDEVGVVNGLAWTAVGGEIMPLESVCVLGTGSLELTGSLGDVMQESAKTAVTLVRSRAEILGIEEDFYKNMDIHINATEAAVPKDGPSAGVTMTISLISSLTGIPVRKDVAMTGEITLRGKVLAIGGLKEKSMAAYKSGIKQVFIPMDNIADLDDVDPCVRDAIIFTPVETIDDIISQALVSNPIAEKKTQKGMLNIKSVKHSESVVVN